jgi:hypothetical protein
MEHDELEPGSTAQALAHEYELRAQALRQFPEIAERGRPGDPQFEEAIEAAMDLIDGSAADELDADLGWLGDEDEDQ